MNNTGDLSKFRPLSDEMILNVVEAVAETERLIEREEGYLPENQNKSYLNWLRNHLTMLNRELEIAFNPDTLIS